VSLYGPWPKPCVVGCAACTRCVAQKDSWESTLVFQQATCSSCRCVWYQTAGHLQQSSAGLLLVTFRYVVREDAAGPVSLAAVVCATAALLLVLGRRCIWLGLCSLPVHVAQSEGRGLQERAQSWPSGGVPCSTPRHVQL
jgi:hypothetical protein